MYNVVLISGVQQSCVCVCIYIYRNVVITYGCESWTIKKAEQEELMLLNCGIGEDFWESLGLQHQSWVSIGRTDVEAETPVLWPPDVKSWLIWKDPDAGKDWGQEEKGTTEGEMAGWHHQLNGHGFGWTLGVGDGQGGLVCCGSWGRKESDTTERLNWTELFFLRFFFHMGYHKILHVVPCAISRSLLVTCFM